MNTEASGTTGSIHVKSSVSNAAPVTLTVTVANNDNTDAIVDVIASAFTHDPLWSWAFPGLATRRIFMQQYINGTLRYPYTFVTQNFEAAALWVPPGGTEFSQEQEDKIPSLLKELVGERADEVEDLLHRFDKAHPQTEPHYFLSLLGTHDIYRGRGIGMALLQENLARIDAMNMPAYLESTNPTNDKRYQSVGFKPISSFQAPGNGPKVTGMWRKKATS